MGTKICVCLWGGGNAIFTVLVALFAYELPLVDSQLRLKRADMEPALAGNLHSFL